MIFLSLILKINSVVFKFKRIHSIATKHDSHNFLQITKNRRFKQSSFTKLTVAEQHNEVAKVFFLRDDNRLQFCCCFISKFCC